MHPLLQTEAPDGEPAVNGSKGQQHTCLLKDGGAAQTPHDHVAVVSVTTSTTGGAVRAAGRVRSWPSVTEAVTSYKISAGLKCRERPE